MKRFLLAALLAPLLSHADPVKWEAEDAKINPAAVAAVQQDKLSGGRGVALQPGIKSQVKDKGRAAQPDLVFTVKAPAPGRYFLRTTASTDAEGAALMAKGKRKEESLTVKLQIDDGRPTRRVVFTPWNAGPVSRTNVGKFDFTGKEQNIGVCLPRGLVLDSIELAPYVPPAVPAAAAAYRPAIVPPTTHPRLFVTQETLAQVRANLEIGENKAAWATVKKNAETPLTFEFDPDDEMRYQPRVENAAREKAFYYLMTGNRAIGREAVKLMCDYLARVEFGNILDVTRPIGRAIYAGAMVYDYCYDLATPEERTILRQNLMRLADDMECGWPPFRQSIVNGHGNEMQINRDLLTMGLAIYDEDPRPYQYCAYKILEKLVPMRKFEYQSPRHNQGINYSSYRFGCEMQGVWLFRRLAGREVFDPNIKEIGKYWLYMRSPDGEMLRDGDGGSLPGVYWTSPQLMMLCYTYADSPVLKGEFLRQGGMDSHLELFLLLNNPNLKAEMSLESLPTTIDFGPILGSMVARTGWNIGEKSDDVVVEIKGGGYNFGNHQQADAGSFQIYYRGILAGDIGLYGFYGTPYDIGFAKRSIAHSLMLAVDPAEKIYRDSANDGGSRFFQIHPLTPEMTRTDPMFNNGNVLFCDFGPDRMRPDYSIFSCEISAAYTEKIKNHTRSFCFLNLNRKDIPAAVIIADDMTTANPAFKKYWQVNTLTPPEVKSDAVILANTLGGRTGKAHVRMLLPKPADRTVDILSGPDANSVFGQRFEIPPRCADYAEAKGHRIMFSPKTPAKRDRFLTVIQIADGDAATLPVESYETGESQVVILADRVVSIGKNPTPIQNAFTIRIPDGGRYEVLLASLAPGTWTVAPANGGKKAVHQVEAGKSTLFFTADGGEYRVTPN
jgi:heparin/heparan-sulfate lyase